MACIRSTCNPCPRFLPPPFIVTVENLIPLTSKVVIAPSASAALLALASREGLLRAIGERADGCLKLCVSRTYPDWLVAQALEQVVLFEQVHMMKFFPKDFLEGEFIESNIFFDIREQAPVTGVITELEPAIFNGILRSDGISPILFVDAAWLERFNIAVNERCAWETKFGENFPADMIVMILELGLKNKGVTVPKYIQAEQIRQRFEEFIPLIRAFTGYFEVVANAQERLAHMMVPIMPGSDYGLYRPPVLTKEFNVPTTLLRLTSSRLGVIPHGQSLRQTLEMAKNPATVALREKITEWTNSIMNDDAATMGKIQKEISKSLDYLKVAKAGSAVSDICTYISVPLALVSLVSGFTTALGWACTIAGTASLATNHVLAKQNRWASFGSSNKA